MQEKRKCCFFISQRKEFDFTPFITNITLQRHVDHGVHSAKAKRSVEKAAMLPLDIRDHPGAL